MYTTSGAAAPARPAHVSRSSGTPRTTRQRLITLVRSIEAYVAGRDSIPEAPARFPTSSSPAARPLVTPPPAGVPCGPDRPLSPQRPRPLAKPAAVAHYEMLARQVAYERQMSDLAAGPPAAVPGPAIRRTVTRG